MKIRYLNIVLLFTIFTVHSVKAQDDTPYYLDVYAGAGYGYYITDMDLEGLNRGGYNLGFRIMWQPEHILSVGLHTGYVSFYSFERKDVETQGGTTDIHADLTAVPIGILFSMKIIEGLQINAGAGMYILNSHANSHGNKVTSSEISTGSLLSLSYVKPVGKNISVGGELKYNFVNKIQDGSLSLSAVLKYTLLEY